MLNFVAKKSTNQKVEQAIYIVTLILTGLINLAMGGILFVGNKAYRQQTVYLRARVLTILWLVAFGLGYFIQAIFLWRYTWPTAASALTVNDTLSPSAAVPSQTKLIEAEEPCPCVV